MGNHYIYSFDVNINHVNEYSLYAPVTVQFENVLAKKNVSRENDAGNKSISNRLKVREWIYQIIYILEFMFKSFKVKAVNQI